jgi:branched-chain amino acid transport system permease protein
MLGFVMLIDAGSAAPRFAESSVTIALLLMVVIGGAVTRWGAVLGGIFYSFASTRMQDLTQQESFKSIPEWIGGPIAEPALLLGLIFIFIVMFAPGGLSGAYYRLRMKALARKHS